MDEENDREKEEKIIINDAEEIDGKVVIDQSCQIILLVVLLHVMPLHRHERASMPEENIASDTTSHRLRQI
jgi:hypothetical protein